MQDGLRNVHSSMIQRCENPKRPQYIRYGGRGIKVYDGNGRFIGWIRIYHTLKRR